MKRTLILGLGLLLAGASGASGQSLFGTSGLGLPIHPVDARAEALGGIGTGLIGENASLVNPADVAGILRRNLSAVFQPTSLDMQLGGNSARRAATHFPLVRLAQPMGTRLVLSLAYAGFTDQSWAIANDGVEQLGDRSVSVQDVVRSRGGLAQARLGMAYMLTPTVAVGADVGLLTGEVQRQITRSFPDTAGPALNSFSMLKRWRYSGPLASAGVRVDVTPVVRLAGSVTWGGELRARGEETGTNGFRVGMPLQATVGAGALLATNLQANLGYHWAGWSRTSGTLLPWSPNPVQAVNSWSFGGGLEWEGIATSDRAFPLRIGARYGTLPFQINGQTPKEWATSIGVGARLAPTQLGAGALVDVSLERGKRGNVATTGLTESFWRVTLSLSVFGR